MDADPPFLGGQVLERHAYGFSGESRRDPLPPLDCHHLSLRQGLVHAAEIQVIRRVHEIGVQMKEGHRSGVFQGQRVGRGPNRFHLVNAESPGQTAEEVPFTSLFQLQNDAGQWG